MPREADASGSSGGREGECCELMLAMSGILIESVWLLELHNNLGGGCMVRAGNVGGYCYWNIE